MQANDWDAKRYEINARFVADLGSPVLELLAPQVGKRILDLGCGDGALTMKLRQSGASVLGIDASLSMVAAAKTLGLDAVQAERRASHRATFPPPLDLPALGSAIDPHAVLKQLHANWFAHLTLPRLVMARQNHKRRQRRIHFATYHRTAATIRLHPRMVEPWVASLFLDYVLFHEMCHHAQAASPLRGETPHSGRFRTWEARFPQLDLALRWERDHLHRFLGG